MLGVPLHGALLERRASDMLIMRRSRVLRRASPDEAAVRPRHLDVHPGAAQHDGHTASSGSSRRQRRRKRTTTGGGPPDRPGDGGDSHERGEPDEALDPEELPAQTTPTREPAAGFSVDTLTAAIKKAKKEGDDESWNSQKGPQRGVRFRGGTPPAPPQWKYQSGDTRAFDRFQRKVNVWALQVKNYMTATEAGLQLHVSLQGDTEMELEHVDVNCIYHKEGVKYILDEPRNAFQQKSVYVKRHYLHEFETIARLPQESMRSFVNRHRRVKVSLKAIGVDMALSYDSESRGATTRGQHSHSNDRRRASKHPRCRRHASDNT